MNHSSECHSPFTEAPPVCLPSPSLVGIAAGSDDDDETPVTYESTL